MKYKQEFTCFLCKSLYWLRGCLKLESWVHLMLSDEGQVILSVWWFSASFMVDSFWWTLMCDPEIFGFVHSPICPSPFSAPDLIAFDLLVLFLPVL